MKKISLIFVIILLSAALTIPCMAEADYRIGQPTQPPITLDDLVDPDVPLGDMGMDDPNGLLGQIRDPIEEIEIDLLPPPLGDIPRASVTPQTGNRMLTPIMLCITSGFGIITTTILIIRKRKIGET